MRILRTPTWGAAAAAGVVLAACLLPTGCRDRSPAVAALVGLEDSLPEMLVRARVPGASLARVVDGETLLTHAGAADPTRRVPVDGETVFPAASLSKPVFAYVVMRLVDRGEWDLDRPLKEIFPNPRIPDPRADAIHSRHVLSHGTGLPNWGGDVLPLAFDPGEGFRYSGEGFVWLQRAVEESTGESLETLARREVFEPLQMTRTSYVWQEAWADDVVRGRDGAGRPVDVPHNTEPNAAHSLLTTAADYLRFAQAVADGTGLSEESHAAMLTPVRPAVPMGGGQASPRLTWGLGWGLERVRTGQAFWHWGDNGAFKSFVLADPGTGRAMTYFSNGSNGLSLMSQLIDGGFSGRHAMAAWLGYERSDDVNFVWRHTLLEAFEESDAVGEQALAAFQALPADAVGLEPLVRTAGILGELGRESAALRVLQSAVERSPESADAHIGLAAARMAAGDHDAAEQSWRRARELAPDDGRAERGLRWNDWVRAAVDAPPVEPAALEEFAGAWGGGEIRVEGGTLQAVFPGRQPETLRPLGDDRFAFVGRGDRLVRFEREDGRVVRAVLMLLDGEEIVLARS